MTTLNPNSNHDGESLAERIQRKRVETLFATEDALCVLDRSILLEAEAGSPIEQSVVYAFARSEMAVALKILQESKDLSIEQTYIF